jgi:hypothetical protein
MLQRVSRAAKRLGRRMRRPTLEDLALQMGTDKSARHHNYVRLYAHYFEAFRRSARNVLEIGVKDGASLRMWKGYFGRAAIHGIDKHMAAKRCEEERIHVHIGLQQDVDFLRSVRASMSGPLDIVVDDGSHHNKYTIASFEALFPLLAPGGIYVIEDLLCSYEAHGMFDNRRQEMTDFFAVLLNSIDLNGRRDILKHVGSSADFSKLTDHLKSQLTVYERWIESVHYYQGLAFVLKRPATA